jgi:hypothetical protein
MESTSFLPETCGVDPHSQQTLIMLIRSSLIATLAALAVFFVLAPSSEITSMSSGIRGIDAGSYYLESHISDIVGIRREFPFLFSGSSNQIDQLGDSHVFRVSLVHSGGATIRLWLELPAPGDVNKLLSQFQLARPGLHLTPEQLFQQFLQHYWKDPREHEKAMLILTSKDKRLEHVRTSKIGSTPQLMFGTNMPIFETQLPVNVTNSTGILFRNSHLVEPLYFHIEIQAKFTGSLSGVIGRESSSEKSKFLAVDYAVLVVGYVNDFRVWLDVGVIPSDAHSGNIFYQLSNNGNVTFYWGEFGTASKPSNKNAAWSNAIGSFNRFFNVLMLHIGKMVMLPNRDVVVDLLNIVNKTVHWKTYTYNQRRIASALLKELLASLIERIVSSPAELRVPFFERLPALAAQPMTKMMQDLVELKQELVETKHRVDDQSALISEQNQKLENQSALISEQNQKLENQSALISEQNQKLENQSVLISGQNEKQVETEARLSAKIDGVFDMVAKLIKLNSHSEL